MGDSDYYNEEDAGVYHNLRDLARRSLMMFRPDERGQCLGCEQDPFHCVCPESEVCPECQGHKRVYIGRIVDRVKGWKDCPTCNGTGFILEPCKEWKNESEETRQALADGVYRISPYALPSQAHDEYFTKIISPEGGDRA